MWLHHAMGISGAVTILTQRRLVYFPVFFGLTELTAFTTNMLWYVQKIYPLYLAEYHPATDSQQKTNGHGNPTTSSTSFSSRSAHLTSDPRAVKLLSRTLFMRAASFFLCRVWVFPYVVYYAVNNVGGWSNFVDRFSQEAFIVKALTISNVTLMGSLNFIWTFWITMKWWGFEKRRRAAEKKGESVRYVNEADEFDQREHEITENLLDKEAKDKSK